MPIDRAEAMRRGWHTGRTPEAIADAIEQAVRETAQECAALVEAKWKPGAPHARLNAAAEIRAAFNLKEVAMQS